MESSTPSTSTTDATSATENPVLNALSGVFGTVFHACRIRSVKEPGQATAQAVAAWFCKQKTAWKSPQDVVTADKFTFEDDATVFHLPNGPAVLVVLAESVNQGYECELKYVVGELPAADSDLIAANLKYALRAAQSQTDTTDVVDSTELVDSYAAQLSQAHEEIDWLHELSGQLGQFEVTRSLQDVAEDTIPALQCLLHAETAVLFGVGGDETAALTDRLRVIHWSGERRLHDSQAKELLIHAGASEATATIVRNRLAVSPPTAELPVVHSMLLAPVTKGRQLFGWVMFLNRSGEASRAITNQEILGLDEFGTEEAGMVEAAASMLASHARNLQLFDERESLMLGTIQTLVRTIEARDEYTCGHSDRVAKMSQLIACQLDVPEYECQRIYKAGLLHDIGKVGVADEVLRKPGRLTDDEFDQIKQHPMIGYRILKDLKSFDYVLPGVRWHHERHDGGGYPDGLKGDEIPLMARVMAVADGLDAMTSNRPYRNGMPFEKAESILREGAGTQWDPDVVAAYFEINDLIQEYCRNHRMSSVMDGLGETSVIVTE